MGLGNNLQGVSGGENVSPTEIDHGLGRRDKFFETLSEKAQQEGIENYTVVPLRNAEESTDSSTTNFIAVPLQKFMGDMCEKILASYYTTKDPAEREAQELADKAVKDTMKELVSQDAILFIPPDEFGKIHKELQKLAEEMIKESRALASKHCKKLPVNEESVKRSLKRDIGARKFQARHNALFQSINRANEAPETGIAPVAAIDGQYGSIGAAHGRYVASLPPNRS